MCNALGMKTAREIELEAENAMLRSIIAEQARTIKRLEERIAVLEKNSRTSSKPPSSDIVKPKHEQRQPGKRKQGGQKGRKGVTRRSLRASEIDRTIEYDISHCPDCATKLQKQVVEVKKHQSFELVEKPVLATEHILKGHHCPCCNVVQFPRLPDDVVPGQLFGAKLQASLCYLKGAMGLSYTELQRVCKELFKVDASTGMLCETIKRGSAALEEPYHQVWEAAQAATHLHADETGWKDSGLLYWVWVFCNQDLSLFAVRDNRSAKVLEEILGERFAGSLISDFFGAYRSYMGERLQFCLAHLIRDVKFLATLSDATTKAFAAKVERCFQSLFAVWHQRHRLGTEQFVKKMNRRKTLLHNYLCRIKLDKGKARTLQRRILKRWQCLFRFVEQPELFAPTNNHAEQQMRHLVRIRRQTQGTRSLDGQQWIERASTVIETCKKQGISVFDFILRAIRATHSYRNPMPSIFAG
jgi:transposase